MEHEPTFEEMATYNDWQLCCPDTTNEIGTKIGEPCSLDHKPNEDCPREYKLKPCASEMIEIDCVVRGQ